jgi:hypothetical protein
MLISALRGNFMFHEARVTARYQGAMRGYEPALLRTTRNGFLMLERALRCYDPADKADVFTQAKLLLAIEKALEESK